MSNYSKFLRQYIKADEFSETERNVILGVSLGMKNRCEKICMYPEALWGKEVDCNGSG